LAQPHLNAICRTYQSAKSCRTTVQPFPYLLFHSGTRFDLFTIHPLIPHYGTHEGDAFIGGLPAPTHPSRYIDQATLKRPSDAAAEAAFGFRERGEQLFTQFLVASAVWMVFFD
jgi:hypothetical protein